MNEPSKREQIEAEQRKITLYARIAHECRQRGDIAGLAQANKARGEAVTMVHRISEIGICATCGAIERVDWTGIEHDEDFWECHNCGRRWSTPHGLKPTEIP